MRTFCEQATIYAAQGCSTCRRVFGRCSSCTYKPVKHQSAGVTSTPFNISRTLILCSVLMHGRQASNGQLHKAKEVRWVTHCADDMRDAHEGIIHRHTEIVHWEAIASQNHKISQSICVKSDVASYPVWYENVFVWRDPESVAVRRPLHQYQRLSMTVERQRWKEF